MSRNITDTINKREWHLEFGAVAERSLHVTEGMIQRLGLHKELEGHAGCVNCLEWNKHGSLLASGSDDSQVIIWHPHHHKILHTIPTGHTGNIFSVKFLPESEDRLVATCAADHHIKVLDVAFREMTHQCTCHTGRVKRLAVAPHLPYLVWSAGEDGLIMQLDLRMKHQCQQTGGGGSVLINLHAQCGRSAEAKCVAVNPCRPDLLAVGANDPFVRVYDRRMVRLKSAASSQSADSGLADGAVQYFSPGHLARPSQNGKSHRHRLRSVAVTYVTYNVDGSQLLANLGGEQVYLFDAVHPRLVDMFNTASLTSPEAAAVQCNGQWPPTPVVLPPRLDSLRLEANAYHQEKRYSLAIQLNSVAIRRRANVPTLYSNRAAAYMKRAWHGDAYAALRDCQRTLSLQPGHVKAGFRMCFCLLELGHVQAAAEALAAFRRLHVEQADSQGVRMLERDLKSELLLLENEPNLATDPMARLERQLGMAPESLTAQELCWRRGAADYWGRYCGHCNTTTDIKEANFFGRDGQFIVAGSDDGTFFVWDRQTAAIVRLLRGDGTIVNCLQPHPQLCLLASSGIDSCVRLWSPLSEGVAESRSVADTEMAAQANQQRMNADPVDMLLLNFGERLGAGDDSTAQSIPCRTS